MARGTPSRPLQSPLMWVGDRRYSSGMLSVFLNGEKVATAEGGGLQPPPSRDGKLKRIKLRKLSLTERGREILPSRNWVEALSGISGSFQIQVQNSDGTVSTFAACKADTAGLSLASTEDPLQEVDFYTLVVE